MARSFGGAVANFLSRSTSIIASTDPRPITVSFWLNVTDRSVASWIFNNNYNSSAPLFGVSVGVSGANNTLRGFSNSSGYTASTAFAWANNTWAHFALTWDTSNLIFYKDGTLINSVATPVVGGGTTAGAALGTLDGAVAGFSISGALAEFAVWSAILNASEIAALGIGVNPRTLRSANLAAYVPVWGIHSPEIDLSGGSSWTVHGTLTAANHAPVVPDRPRWRSVFVPAVVSGNDLSGGFSITPATIAGNLTETFILSGGPTLGNVTVAGALTSSGITTLSGGPTLANVTLAGTLAETFILSGGATLAQPVISGTLVNTWLSGGPTLARLVLSGNLTIPAAAAPAPGIGSAVVVNPVQPGSAVYTLTAPLPGRAVFA